MRIRSFEPRDQAAARQLILEGLGEHFGWIDETCNPDLDNIAANYIERGSTFLVAESDGGVVGTAALIAENKDTGRLVRVSVSPTYRRRGVGRVLVSRLLKVAKSKGFATVRVSTDDGWEDAIGLYKDCGFSEDKCDAAGVHLALKLVES